MLNDLDLEEKELEFFKTIRFHLKDGLKDIIKGLNSRIKILDDWYNNFIKTARKGYKASDLDTGAERILHHFFAPFLKSPNSSPIGSDLMYEHPDAFFHIEIKTALIDNPADYKGKINIGINQTSYGIQNLFSPNLPTYYKPNDSIEEKPCLTYIIQIVHEHAKPNIKALLLACIPNGQLYNIYKNSIVRSGKGGYKRAKDFRYNYVVNPYFQLLKEKYREEKFRIELIYLAKDLKPEDITNIKNIPVHFQF